MDGIFLQRVIDQVKTDILLVSEDLGVFGPVATLSEWDFAFPVGPGSSITFNLETADGYPPRAPKTLIKKKE